MALYTAQSGLTALSASTTRTLLQLVSAATDRARIVQWAISFNGTTALTPVEVTLERQTTAGTSSAGTIVKYDTGDGSAASSVGITFTSTDPTASDLLERHYISPNGGLLIVQYPLGREPVMAASTRMAIKTVTAAGVTPTAVASIIWDE